MTEKHFILATAGHVDHGKSALVKALTGTDPDRLPEEKARGITIDLGFAELNLTRPDGEKFHIGIVDVPGHEDFVRNMLAGVGSIDLALLVVAADDSWMPQTEEHLQILRYLDVKRIVVALTKSDLGNTDVVTDQIAQKLHDTPFANSPIVPTSIRTGAGIENLKSELASEFTKIDPPRDIGKPRLFVDRAFTLQGIGTVVTGTLTDGSLHAGDDIFVGPGNISARIRSLQTHGRDVEFATSGMRTALNLPDLAAGSDIERGDVIIAEPFEPTLILGAVLTRSSRVQRATPIKSRTSAYVHHGTTRALTKIIFPTTESLAPGQTAVAQLRLSEPLLAFVGDRFVVRDPSEQHTIAGGVVVDVRPDGFYSDAHRDLVSCRAAAPHDVDLALWTEVAGDRVLAISGLLQRSHFSSKEIADAVERLDAKEAIFRHENVIASARAWRELRKRAGELIDSTHHAHPERGGLDLNELRANSQQPEEVFEALVVDLCRAEFVRVGSAIARRSHRPALPPELKTVAEAIKMRLAAKPFDPPGRKELVPDRQSQQALQFLIDSGEVIDVGSDLVLLRENFEQMKAQVIEFISTKGPATASQLREKLGTSRRVIIPFLEYLDRIGVTQRIGDLRQLRETKSAAVARR
jgi:selenocysteine-specific elongation factor